MLYIQSLKKMVKYTFDKIAEVPKGGRYAAWECKIDEPAFKWIPMNSVVNGKSFPRGRWLKVADDDCLNGPYEAGYLRRERLQLKAEEKASKRQVKIEKKRIKVEKLEAELDRSHRQLKMLEEEDEKEQARMQELPKDEFIRRGYISVKEDDFQSLVNEVKELRRLANERELLNRFAQQNDENDGDSTDSEE